MSEGTPLSIHDFSNGLGDTDTYIFYSHQFYQHWYPDKTAVFEFINRPRNPMRFPEGFGRTLQGLVEQMSDLTLTPEVRQHLLKGAPFLDPKNLDKLEQFRFKPEQVEIAQTGEDLAMRVIGPVPEVVFWEIPLMHLTTQLYNEMLEREPMEGWEDRVRQALRNLSEAGVRLSMMGSRRRFSKAVDERTTQIAKEEYNPDLLVVSNVFNSYKYDIPFGGTTPHQIYQAHAAMYGYTDANYMTLLNWNQEFKGQQKVFLTDTFTTEVALRNFDQLITDHPELAGVFTRFRQDSQDPFVYLERLVKFVDAHKWPRESRSILYSDGLDDQRAIALHKASKNVGIGDAAGIGTFFSHTLTGHKGADIVIKLVKFDGKKTVKFSDEPAKASGDPKEIERARKELQIYTPGV